MGTKKSIFIALIVVSALLLFTIIFRFVIIEEKKDILTFFSGFMTGIVLTITFGNVKDIIRCLRKS